MGHSAVAVYFLIFDLRPPCRLKKNEFFFVLFDSGVRNILLKGKFKNTVIEDYTPNT